MIDLSIRQALSVWAELEDAYRGEHPYGSTDAEVYAYRLLPRDPAAEAWLRERAGGSSAKEAAEAHGRLAAANLAALCALFEQERDCTITIAVGPPHGRVAAAACPPFTHRIVVCVRRPGRP